MTPVAVVAGVIGYLMVAFVCASLFAKDTYADAERKREPGEPTWEPDGFALVGLGTVGLMWPVVLVVMAVYLPLRAVGKVGLWLSRQR